MHQSSFTRGSVIAAAVAALAGCASNQPAPAASGTTAESVRCLGINSCHGQGECATADHSCGKHTPCKGQGWLSVDSAEACTSQGGKIL
jgi:hypothetical protein